MNSLNNDWLEETFVTFGHQDANVTLPVVIEPICNHQMKMDGSGLDLALKLVSFSYTYLFRILSKFVKYVIYIH